jgi:hypothetical protein
MSEQTPIPGPSPSSSPSPPARSASSAGMSRARAVRRRRTGVAAQRRPAIVLERLGLLVQRENASTGR